MIHYIPYFTKAELECRATGKLFLAEGFAEQLVNLRKKYAQPMIVTSCCRSKAYNQKIGGSQSSFHIYDSPRYGFIGTCAIDIATSNLHDKGHLFSLAWTLGWSIGFHRHFLHLDRRIDYTNMQQIVFGY